MDKIITVSINKFPGNSDSKALPARWETWVQSLGWEDPLEKGVATHSIFLPGESHGQRSLVGYSPWGRTESDMTETTQHARVIAVLLHKYLTI